MLILKGLTVHQNCVTSGNGALNGERTDLALAWVGLLRKNGARKTPNCRHKHGGE